MIAAIGRCRIARNICYMISRAGRIEVKFDFTLDVRDLPEWVPRTGLADGRLVHSLDSGKDVTRYQESRIIDMCDHQGFLRECKPNQLDGYNSFVDAIPCVTGAYYGKPPRQDIICGAHPSRNVLSTGGSPHHPPC